MNLHLLQIYIWRHSGSFLFIIIKDRFYEDYIYLLYLFNYLFMIFVIFIDSFISSIYLLESYIY